MIMRLAGLLLLAGVAACGYRAPAGAESPTYRADLRSCREAAEAAVNERNAKTGLAWFSSPVLRWGQIGDATAACMDGKGYLRTSSR